ncbi:hypothetical protein MHAE_10578 [Mycobacterium haemophilum DSM 44634]|uniref:hypothetical protein n=1 Tax=Mycobacterium haemophilum TaxID=29311 RepID=UPI000655DBE3|nr:hypothetical protein [Mycobacterium haemophilum]AKN16579.1 hypothetical protein B586_08450 [Mycobacterium haemophilum DSM 44634]MCV7342623.1 hypothetical protein [Mycobacterium haemophilum DSM 44634]
MAEANEGQPDSALSKADAMALAEEAEAEAAAAEALAAAARARARAARLRRDVQAPAEAADTKTGDETSAAAKTEALTKPAARRRRWLRLPSLATIAKAAAIVLILACGGFSGYMAWQHRDTAQRQQRTAAFVAGARQGVVNLTSLDFNKAQEDVQRVIDSSTGEFRDDFQKRAADFTKVVEQSKVVTQGTVNAAAVESMSDRAALVLVSATSRITNSAGAKNEPRAWRLRVTVTEDGGQYKMSKVEFVP